MDLRTGLLALMICVINASELYSLDSQVGNVLNKCTDQLVELIRCLRHDSPLLYKLKTCDDYLTRCFICLSTQPETPFVHAHQKAIQNGDTIVIKRGLGRCIHNCLQGQGRMNFIQCKSMCHR